MNFEAAVHQGQFAVGRHLFPRIALGRGDACISTRGCHRLIDRLPVQQLPVRRRLHIDVEIQRRTGGELEFSAVGVIGAVHGDGFHGAQVRGTYSGPHGGITNVADRIALGGIIDNRPQVTLRVFLRFRAGIADLTDDGADVHAGKYTLPRAVLSALKLVVEDDVVSGGLVGNGVGDPVLVVVPQQSAVLEVVLGGAHRANPFGVAGLLHADRLEGHDLLGKHHVIRMLLIQLLIPDGEFQTSDLIILVGYLDLCGGRRIQEGAAVQHTHPAVADVRVGVGHDIPHQDAMVGIIFDGRPKPLVFRQMELDLHHRQARSLPVIFEGDGIGGGRDLRLGTVADTVGRSGVHTDRGGIHFRAAGQQVIEDTVGQQEGRHHFIGQGGTDCIRQTEPDLPVLGAGGGVIHHIAFHILFQRCLAIQRVDPLGPVLNTGAKALPFIPVIGLAVLLPDLIFTKVSEIGPIEGIHTRILRIDHIQTDAVLHVLRRHEMCA